MTPKVIHQGAIYKKSKVRSTRKSCYYCKKRKNIKDFEPETKIDINVCSRCKEEGEKGNHFNKMKNKYEKLPSWSSTFDSWKQ